MARPNILIVDDDYSFAEFAKMLLEKSGFRASVALTGERALEMASSAGPDLILMDINMPQMSGIEAISRLKSNPRTHEIPIVVCSISHSPSELRKAYESGAVDFLPKPVKRDRLKIAVDKALGRRPA